MDGMNNSGEACLSPNSIENAKLDNWNRMINQDNLLELKNRILSQTLGVDQMSAKNPFLPHFPYLPRGQFPIVPPTVSFDTAAAFSYLAQITATANALHSSEYTFGVDQICDFALPIIGFYSITCRSTRLQCSSCCTCVTNQKGKVHNTTKSSIISISDTITIPIQLRYVRCTTQPNQTKAIITESYESSGMSYS